jgi:hypothetical protein
MALPTSLRLPPDLDRSLEAYARRTRSSKASLIVQATREWLNLQAHPRVCFVSTVEGERRAALLAGPQVWTVAESWLQQEPGEGRLEATVDSTGLEAPEVEAALAYWADNRAEIDGIVEAHRLEQDEALAAWERIRALMETA